MPGALTSTKTISTTERKATFTFSKNAARLICLPIHFACAPRPRRAGNVGAIRDRHLALLKRTSLTLRGCKHACSADRKNLTRSAMAARSSAGPPLALGASTLGPHTPSEAVLCSDPSNEPPWMAGRGRAYTVRVNRSWHTDTQTHRHARRQPSEPLDRTVNLPSSAARHGGVAW